MGLLGHLSWPNVALLHPMENTKTEVSPYDCPDRDAKGHLPQEYMHAVMHACDVEGMEVESEWPWGEWRSAGQDVNWDWYFFNYRIRRPQV